MKRCTECDFIYENEQSLCEMDGAELISEPTRALVLPEKSAIEQQSKSQPKPTQWWRLAFLPFAALILCAIPFFFNDIFTHQTSASQPQQQQRSITEEEPPSQQAVSMAAAGAQPASEELPVAATTPVVESVDASPSPATAARPKAAVKAFAKDSRTATTTAARPPADSPRLTVPQQNEEKKLKPATINTVASPHPATPRTAVKPANNVPPPVAATPKKESFLGFLVKKTGRFLKKPFKL